MPQGGALAVLLALSVPVGAALDVAAQLRRAREALIDDDLRAELADRARTALEQVPALAVVPLPDGRLGAKTPEPDSLDAAVVFQ